MRRLCWIFPDRSSSRQRFMEQQVFWRHYIAAAKAAGLALSYHAPDAIAVDATDPVKPLVYLDGEQIKPQDTIFVTELFTFPHQLVDVFDQLTLFMTLEQAGFYLPIPPRLSFIATDKAATLLYLRDCPIPAVPTVRLPTGRESSAPYRDPAPLLSGFEYPLIVKPVAWGGGMGVCVARTPDDLYSLVSLASGIGCTLAIQPYLGPETVDYRVFFVDGVPHTTLRREPVRSAYVGNAAQGGKVSIVDVPEPLLAAAAYLSEKFPIPYFAVDFLHDGHRFRLSEVEPDGGHGNYVQDATGLLQARFRAYATAHEGFLAG